jgi:riboflavin kinase / FMN adenylyltransferase
MNAETRANRLAKLGVDLLYELPFDARLADLGAEEFAREVLSEGLGRGACRGRAPISASARAGGAMPPCCETWARRWDSASLWPSCWKAMDGRVSSTAIRAALTAGNPARRRRHAGPLAPDRRRGLHGASAAAIWAIPPPTCRWPGCTCRAWASMRCLSMC